MSDFTDSLRNEDDDEIKSFLLNILEKTENRHTDAVSENNNDEENYWQGRKDSIRIILAYVLERPEIATINSTTSFAYFHNISLDKR